MTRKVLTDLSPSATQDITTITLNKSDLGLTGTTNSLDQIIAAIMIKSSSILNQTQYNNELTESVYVATGFPSFTTRNNTSYRVDQLTLNMVKLDSGATLNPSDY